MEIIKAIWWEAIWEAIFIIMSTSSNIFACWNSRWVQSHAWARAGTSEPDEMSCRATLAQLVPGPRLALHTSGAFWEISQTSKKWFIRCVLASNAVSNEHYFAKVLVYIPHEGIWKVSIPQSRAQSLYVLFAGASSKTLRYTHQLHTRTFRCWWDAGMRCVPQV